MRTTTTTPPRQRVASSTGATSSCTPSSRLHERVARHCRRLRGHQGHGTRENPAAGVDDPGGDADRRIGEPVITPTAGESRTLSAKCRGRKALRTSGHSGGDPASGENRTPASAGCLSGKLIYHVHIV